MYGNKIRTLQLDPNGYCNAKCWYCPVQYQTEKNKIVMPVEKIDEILNFFYEEKQKDIIVSKHFEVIWTSSFNEILLYPYLDQLLELFRKYNFKTPILSHGLNLTNAKVDLLYEYRDVIVSLGLNIPAFEKTLWSKRVGFQEQHFDKLIDNVMYAGSKLKDTDMDLFIFVNGITNDTLEIYDLQPKVNEIGYTQSEQMEQVKLASELFDNYTTIPFGINNRSDNLEEYIIVKDNKTQVSACGMEVDHSRDNIMKNIKHKNFGNRMRNWLHIAPNGDTFICCLDYENKYVFGNVFEDSIKSIWLGDKRIEVVQSALKNFCTQCHYGL